MEECPGGGNAKGNGPWVGIFLVYSGTMWRFIQLGHGLWSSRVAIPSSSYSQAPHPSCWHDTVHKAGYSLSTFSPRPYVLNFLLFAIQNLLSSFMPLDPAIREQTTQESLRPSGLMHEE